MQLRQPSPKGCRGRRLATRSPWTHTEGCAVPASPWDIEQGPTTHQCTQGGHPLPPALCARRGEVDGEVASGGRDRHLTVL